MAIYPLRSWQSYRSEIHGHARKHRELINTNPFKADTELCMADTAYYEATEGYHP